MLKKILILFIAFIGTFSVGYAYYNLSLNAANPLYQGGGNVTGRIHQAPSNITGNNIGFQKGDKVYIGVTNPKDGGPLGWQLIHHVKNYEYYKTTPNGNGTNDFVKDKPISAWFSMSTDDIGSTNILDSWSSTNWIIPLKQTKLAGYIDQLNTNLINNKLVTYRDLTASRDKLITSTEASEIVRLGTDIRDSYNGKISFISGYVDLQLCSLSYNLPIKDRTFKTDYFAAENQYGQGVSFAASSMFDGTTGQFKWNSISMNSVIRPSIMLDIDKTVFAISSGNSNDIAEISELYLDNYTSLYQATSSHKEMKLRLYDPSMIAELKKIQNNEGKDITKVIEGDSIKLLGYANAGNDSNGIYTISVIIFNEAGQFA